MDTAAFNTPTMAELFVSQGKTARAVGILRHVVKSRPGDEAARLRLAELETLLGAAPGGQMIFREHMRRIVEAVPGATACALMGLDGIAIDSYEVGGSALDIPVLLTEYSAVAQTLRQCGQEQPLCGIMRELTITTTHLTTVLCLLGDAYFVAVVLGPEGLAGKARFMLRQAVPAILKDLG